ncbi:hypothetical protein DFJ74DRAFT_687468 [Hyaloraphidium curvatum]|nr:hypothetical protein DFJ74DRAFT_687468 [Hyaloraphidium curvatum]
MDIRVSGGPAAARLLRGAPAKRLAWISLAVLLYALVLPAVWRTVGEPRRVAELALAEKRETADERAFDALDDFGADDLDAASDLDAESDLDGGFKANVTRAKNSTDEDFDFKAAEEALPPGWLPSPLPMLGLFGAITAHALFHLCCRWYPPFEAAALYDAAPAVRRGDATHAIVFPPPNRGKPAIVPLDWAIDAKAYQENAPPPSADAGDPGPPLARLTFQRQPLLLHRDAILPLPLPTSLPLSHYLDSAGIDPSKVPALRDMYGVNDVALPPPRFWELLFEQMLSPLAVFQVFSALLWFLDGYSLAYTGISIGSTVMFEGMTVLQRTRTTGMLGTLSPPPRKVRVYRGAWIEVGEKEVLPGDLVLVEEGNIAFDCVLVAGNGVVNEAMLTGESIPLLKDPLAPPADGSASAPLDPAEAHRTHCLSSGTTLLSATPPTQPLPSGAPLPEAKGLVAVVLRTGFASEQGRLLQLIAYSQSPVSSDTRETFMALLLLFSFALVAAGYVWREGREKGKDVQELVVRAIVIVTSVVPRGLPMQMATAVHTALLSLFRAGIFCTEPHKVPLAGKVSHVVFDKTGTVTTDRLVPVGVVNADGAGRAEDTWGMKEVKEAKGMAAVVLAACHSIVAVADKKDDKAKEANGAEQANGSSSEVAKKDDQPAKAAAREHLAGDPIELAALKGVEWTWDHASSAATPGVFRLRELALGVVKKRLAELQSVPSSQRTPEHAAKTKKAEQEVAEAEAGVAEAKKKAGESRYARVEVVARHHFASGLQRMSVVAKGIPRGSGKEDWVCLVKGSPEAIKGLLEEGAAPEWYQACYEGMARKGLRVLALAYKSAKASDRPAERPREWVESGLQFAGFAAFECKVRADSGAVVRALRESGHAVGMLTGDGLLTSVHVAKAVGISGGRTATLRNAGGKFWWDCEGADGAVHEAEFDAARVGELAARFDLVCTEGDFLAATESSGGKQSPLWQHAGSFKVFARMSPHGKAAVIRAVQSADADAHVLMCGDGGNDVGALKQADVSMALLAGHGDSNTSDEVGAEGQNAEEALNKHTAELQKKSKEFEAALNKHMKDFQARYNNENTAAVQKEIQERTEKGEYLAIWTVMKENAVKMRNAMEAENRRFHAVHGQIWDPKKGAGSAEKGGMFGTLMAQLEADSGDPSTLPMIRPGDASVAAPFTSRVPSIRAVVDLIRQGRCTLLSALMQQQIMMLESTIAAYTLSALTLHNARSSERQMMASSWLIMTAAVAFSYASPIDRMHPLRPIRSLFHPSVICSIFGQALIHIACMTLAVQWATDAMGPEKLAEVTEFFRKAKAKEIDVYANCGDSDYVCLAQAFWTAPFMPNLLNSVVFLVETSQMISVFFANYKGRPWMKGMMENHALFLSVFICIAAVVVAAWEMVPMLNEMLQLVPFPDDAFRYRVVGLLSATIAGTLLWDRFCTWLFAPDIFAAMLEEAMNTTPADLVPILSTALKVMGVVFVLGTGNIFLAGAAFFGWRNYQKFRAEQEALRQQQA